MNTVDLSTKKYNNYSDQGPDRDQDEDNSEGDSGGEDVNESHIAVRNLLSEFASENNNSDQQSTSDECSKPDSYETKMADVNNYGVATVSRPLLLHHPPPYPPSLSSLGLAIGGVAFPATAAAAMAVYQQTTNHTAHDNGDAPQEPTPKRSRKSSSAASNQDANGSLIVSCDVCGKTFKNESGLRNHAKNAKCGAKPAAKVGPYKCTYCPRSYTTKMNKDNHEKLHTNPNAFDCPKCGKRFLSHSGLRRHHVQTPCE